MIEHEKASTDEEKKEKNKHTHQSDLLNNRALGV